MSSLRELKEGDSVAIVTLGGWHLIPPHKRTVKRITKTQIVTDMDCRFRIKDGTPLGAGRYSREKLEPWGAEHDKTVDLVKAIRRRSTLLDEIECLLKSGFRCECDAHDHVAILEAALSMLKPSVEAPTPDAAQ